MDDIFEMKLHDLFTLEGAEKNNYEVLRVPGGWIYTRRGAYGYSSVFVPFEKEFGNFSYCTTGPR